MTSRNLKKYTHIIIIIIIITILRQNLTMQARLPLNSEISSFCLLSTGIKGVDHHIWSMIYFLLMCMCVHLPIYVCTMCIQVHSEGQKRAQWYTVIPAPWEVEAGRSLNSRPAKVHSKTKVKQTKNHSWAPAHLRVGTSPWKRLTQGGACSQHLLASKCASSIWWSFQHLTRQEVSHGTNVYVHSCCCELGMGPLSWGSTSPGNWTNQVSGIRFSWN